MLFSINYSASGASYTESLNTSVLVTKLGTILEMNAKPQEFKKDGSTIINATLLDDNANPVAAQTLNFYNETHFMGSLTTDSNGNAQMKYTGVDVGVHALSVSYNESAGYLSSISAIYITVDKLGTNISASFTPSKEKMVMVSATLEDENGKSVGNTVIDFQVFDHNNWSDFGSASTNLEGLASVAYTPSSDGLLKVRAVFNGTAEYVGSASQQVSFFVILFDTPAVCGVFLVAVAFGSTLCYALLWTGRRRFQ